MQHGVWPAVREDLGLPVCAWAPVPRDVASACRLPPPPPLSPVPVSAPGTARHCRPHTAAGGQTSARHPWGREGALPAPPTASSAPLVHRPRGLRSSPGAQIRSCPLGDTLGSLPVLPGCPGGWARRRAGAEPWEKGQHRPRGGTQEVTSERRWGRRGGGDTGSASPGSPGNIATALQMSKARREQTRPPGGCPGMPPAYCSRRRRPARPLGLGPWR